MWPLTTVECEAEDRDPQQTRSPATAIGQHDLFRGLRPGPGRQQRVPNTPRTKGTIDSWYTDAEVSSCAFSKAQSSTRRNTVPDDTARRYSRKFGVLPSGRAPPPRARHLDGLRMPLARDHEQRSEDATIKKPVGDRNAGAVTPATAEARSPTERRRCRHCDLLEHREYSEVIATVPAI